ERFGQLAASVGAQLPDGVASPVPVERVLEVVVAPVARMRPVFMLVMDGLSRAIYQDLLESMGDAGWQLREPEGTAGPLRWSALAAVPSITEISRTSLFSGRLNSGEAATEKREFSSHSALLQASRARRPPVLFHKGELLGPSGRGLSDDVRTALSDGEQRIV